MDLAPKGRRMPYLTDLRYRSEYMALRLLVALMHALPLEVSVNVSGKVLRLMARFDRRHKRALQNLEIAFPPQERQMPSFFVSMSVARSASRAAARDQNATKVSLVT
jgi:lauroyl/myristoyl acyltransferase